MSTNYRQIPLKRRRLWLTSACLLLPCGGLLLSAHAVQNSGQRTGEQIFKNTCAPCHGAKGQGGKQYPKPLTGTRSVGQLATFIKKSMPPGDRKKLPAADAQKVAAYIHDAFYSPIAQARNRPARVELSRLTVRQYQNAVADLIASFRPGPQPDTRRGLQAVYFKTGQMGGRRGGERVLERVDSEIKFDFGTTGALPAQDDPYTFAMRWEGSVIAPDTGEYEFIVRSEHAVRFWINDLRIPLIDGYVKSGDGNEYAAPLYLLGGRAYPMRLEFSKGVVGVNDLKEVKKKPPTKASVALEWRRPKLARETIPQRCLLPVQVNEAFVVSSPFPPDDRSIGYERGTSVSKAWEEATTEGAIETARFVLERLGDQPGVRIVDRRAESFGGNPASINFDAERNSAPEGDKAAKLRGFCRQFVERAFRRPLTPELEKVYIDRPIAGAPDPETAVKRVVLLALKSPRFLYREMKSGEPDSYDVASRLSFGLWDSLPDEELLKAAAAGELKTREQVVKQTERMLQDPRAWFKLREFLLQWLKVDQFPDLAKDPKRYPDFNESVHSDLRTSLELFLEEVAWGAKSDFRQLLLTDRVYLNGRLAKIYGAHLPQESPFQFVLYQPEERAGVLTHPYLLASFAYLDASSPIHRGVLIARNLLGRMLQPPPEAFTPIPATLHPKLTTRQRVALQTRPPACMSCHTMINPLGFTLEKFDAIGKLRARENGRPVDSTGSYETRSGKVVKFNGVRDLARFLADSEESHAAFVEKLFHHTVKQPVRAYGPQALGNLQTAFTANQCSIRKQMVEIMAISALKR